VKLATHTPTGELVAIKVLEKSKMQSEADVVRVTREVNILKQVKHPNIAQLYQIIETPNKICLVLEYLPRGELYDMIVRQKKLREAEAAKYFTQLMCVVQYMHSLGVSHRDLKPENLLLSDKLDLKVIDFGLSNHFSEATLLRTACGSPCYAAPEMVGGEAYSGSKVDMWSCGVVLYAMTVGKLPFDDPNSAELYRRILKGKFSCPSHLSDNLKELLVGLLMVDPAKRYSVPQTLSSAWLRLYSEPSPQRELSAGVLPGVLSRLRELGVDVDYTQQCLEGQKHNQFTTAYFLMLKKMLREGSVPRLESTRRLSPKLSLKSQTTRPQTANFNATVSLTSTLRKDADTVLRPKLKLLKPHPPSKPSISPQRRVLKPAETRPRGLTPHQPARGRSTSTKRSQSRRSTSTGRSALAALKQSKASEGSSVCWTSNKPIGEVGEEVRRGLQALKFSFRVSEEGFVWEHQQVLAELVLRRLGTLTILKSKLLSGTAQVYRDLCSRLLCSISL
jgi:serine/threonine protein kinase